MNLEARHALAVSSSRSSQTKVRLSKTQVTPPTKIERSLGRFITIQSPYCPRRARWVDSAPGDLDERLNRLRTNLQDIENRLYGNRTKRQVGERVSPTVESRLSAVDLGVYHSTYGPTATLRTTLEIADAQLEQIKSDLEEAQSEAAALGVDLVRAGAPWVGGNPLPRGPGG